MPLKSSAEEIRQQKTQMPLDVGVQRRSRHETKSCSGRVFSANQRNAIAKMPLGAALSANQ